MRVQTEIDRINTSVTAAYAVMEGMGATMPSDKNVDNLAATAATIPRGTEPVAKNVILPSGGWVDGQQTVTVDGISEDSILFAGGDMGSEPAYSASGVYCSGKSAGKLTFTCSYTPDEDVVANVIILN